MDIQVKQGDIAEEAADVIVVNLFQGIRTPGGATGVVDAVLNGAIQEVISSGDFTGKLRETIVLYTRGALPSPRVIVVGLGERDRFKLSTVRGVAAAAARKARELGARTIATISHGSGIGGLDPVSTAAAVVEGTLLGLYRFAGYRSQPPKDWRPDPVSLTIVGIDEPRVSGFRIGARRGEALAQGVNLARDLVSTPANLMTPIILAERAIAAAQEVGLGVTVLDRAAMQELGMGILLAVAAASEQEPRFVILEHNAGRTDLPTVVLAGKGVTFDSGGISLKPGEEMWRMKGDMAGAAAVLGALVTAARLALPVHAVGLMPCAENLPGGGAQKPGDVYRGMSGKTMEVISTDAEGRMLLADALAYAGRFAPQAVVDIATLTGTQHMAFGPQAAAFFSNDDVLAQRLQGSGESSDDRVWRMPLFDEYAEPIRSQVADVKNSGGRNGGMGTSAKFLQHFTDGYPWAHIDMASMSQSDEDKPLQPKGATGYGVRLLTTLLESYGQPSQP